MEENKQNRNSLQGFSKDAKLLDAFIQKIEDIDKNIIELKKSVAKQKTEQPESITVISKNLDFIKSNLPQSNNHHLLNLKNEIENLRKEQNNLLSIIQKSLNNQEDIAKMYKSFYESKAFIKFNGFINTPYYYIIVPITIFVFGFMLCLMLKF